MLPAAARLRSPGDFAEVIRHGRRFGRTLVVMHALVPIQAPGVPRAHARPAATHSCNRGGGAAVVTRHSTCPGPRVGFVVSKAVGGSVVRHRVARRLRHLLRDRLDKLPAGTRLVVRALPGAATADWARLAEDVDRALRAVLADATAAGDRR